MHATLFESDMSFENLLFNLVRFIIALDIGLFIKVLLLALTNSCFKGAVLFRATLHISKKKMQSSVISIVQVSTKFFNK